VAKGSILVVDDDQIILNSLSEFLRLEGYEVQTAEKFEEAVAWLDQKPFDVMITDVSMPDVDGFELLKVCKNRHSDVAVIMVTGYGTIESAVEAIKMGAYDYLTKPIIDDEIKLVIERAMRQQALVGENRNLRQQLNMRYSLDNVIGNDYKMLRVFDLIEAVADSKATVLITGESGTGKSLIARTIHQRSSRSDKPFVEVACGALPETLLESELFGHTKGSFTGAISDKAGKFEAANKGTIFLDEISTASPALQVKLLRVLQTFEFERVGSTETIKTDTRVILATNRDLMQDVKEGKFRQDLYYRINVVSIDLPPLRERISDIPLLAESFLKLYCERSGRMLLNFSEDAMRLMQTYSWPGNVRELENVVERATVLARGRTIEVNDLPPTLLRQVEEKATTADDGRILPLKDALEKPEKEIIERALRANNWNRQLTADLLEINRTTLYKKMKKYGLDFSEPMPRG
jgi:DNA-binding NtrC family response regulator